MDASFAEVEREITRDDDGFFAVGELVVEITPEISIFSLVSRSRAHVDPFCFSKY